MLKIFLAKVIFAKIRVFIQRVTIKDTYFFVFWGIEESLGKSFCNCKVSNCSTFVSERIDDRNCVSFRGIYSATARTTLMTMDVTSC